MALLPPLDCGVCSRWPCDRGAPRGWTRRRRTCARQRLVQFHIEQPVGLIILKQAVGDTSHGAVADGKINLLMGEMSDEIDYLKQFKLPKRTDEFPLVLSAGERRLTLQIRWCETQTG